MNINRVDVIKIELHLAKNILELWDKSIQHMQVVHFSQCPANPLGVAQDRHERLVHLPRTTDLVID